MTIESLYRLLLRYYTLTKVEARLLLLVRASVSTMGSLFVRLQGFRGGVSYLAVSALLAGLRFRV